MTFWNGGLDRGVPASGCDFSCWRDNYDNPQKSNRRRTACRWSDTCDGTKRSCDRWRTAGCGRSCGQSRIYARKSWTGFQPRAPFAIRSEGQPAQKSVHVSKRHPPCPKLAPGPEQQAVGHSKSKLVAPDRWVVRGSFSRLGASSDHPSLNGRSTMSHAKRASKRRSRAKAVTVLGVAGALSLAGGASGAAVGPPGDTLTANMAITPELT